MGRAFDLDVFLVLGGERGADRGIVGRGDRVVGAVDDLDDRAGRNAGGVVPALGIRMIVGPLREPRPQGREPRETGGRGVCNARVAEEAPARLAAVGINRRVEPAHVAVGAMNHEAALHLAVVAAREGVKELARPGRDLAVARKLGSAEGSDKFGRIRRFVGCAGRVDVEREIAGVGIEFVAHRRIEPFGQGLGAAEVRGDEDDAVRRLQASLRQVVGIAGRRLRDARALGLRLVEQRQRAAARPADQNHLAIPEHVARVANILSEVVGDLLHDQRAVVLGVATAGA